VNKAPPAVTRKARPLPGEEYESPKPLPPLENVVQELPPASTEPLTAPEPQPEESQNSAEPAPEPDQPQEPANQL
jgi:hypothetical protein